MEKERGEGSPLSPLLFWLPPPAAGPAKCPGRCFLTCGLLNYKTEKQHKCYYSAGPELRQRHVDSFASLFIFFLTQRHVTTRLAADPEGQGI